MKQKIRIKACLSILVVLLLCCWAEAASAGLASDIVHIDITADSTTATTSLRSAPILISAAVDRAGVPVPDGTAVDFAVSSGIGALRDATATVDGTATVSLSSTTVGPVTVSATYGTISASITVSFRAQPRQALVRIATAGSPPTSTLIGGLLASLSYPSEGCRITSGDVTPSGVAASATTTLAANVEKEGLVILALLDADGLGIGEFATLTFQVADGFLPDMDDFTIMPNPSVTSAVGNAAMPGIGVVVQSLTLR